MYGFYLFSKAAKYIALVSLVLSFFNDWIIFKWLCCLVFIDIAIAFPVLKCSLLQVIGMHKVNRKYGNNIPSADNYKNKVEYILPFNGTWVAVNGCYTEEFSHSWGIPTQRYAYDFIILDEKGKSYHGEFDKYGNYYCYDQEILAPADGLVVEVVNGAKDSLIFPGGRLFSRARHIAGNYIVIKHAEHEYSTLAHLKKDSIMVKTGDLVSQGQVIGRCGNTGNSTEPHLHFQLQTDASFYNSAGLPIQFKSIDLSAAENYEQFDSRTHMAYSQISEGYISRGIAVKNRGL